MTRAVEQFNSAVEWADLLLGPEADTLDVPELLAALRFASWSHSPDFGLCAETLEQAARAIGYETKQRGTEPQKAHNESKH